MRTAPRVSWWVAAIGFVSLSMLGATWAQGAPGFPSVTHAEQTARDSDRVRILREEVERESQLVEDQTKRRAERLAAGDRRGVQESEEALQRHAQDIQTLRHEIDLAKQKIAIDTTSSGAPPTFSATRHPAATKGSAETVKSPWWDVYGRTPKSAQSPAPASPSDVRRLGEDGQARPVR